MARRARAAEPGLEEALARLDEINARLEDGDLELAEALALYEEGVRLVRAADELLGTVEARIEQLRPDAARDVDAADAG